MRFGSVSEHLPYVKLIYNITSDRNRTDVENILSSLPGFIRFIALEHAEFTSEEEVDNYELRLQLELEEDNDAAVSHCNCIGIMETQPCFKRLREGIVHKQVFAVEHPMDRNAVFVMKTIHLTHLPRIVGVHCLGNEVRVLNLLHISDHGGSGGDEDGDRNDGHERRGDGLEDVLSNDAGNIFRYDTGES